MFVLPEHSWEFPNPEDIDDDIIAIGGDLNPQRILSAYRQGIFPWYSEQPIKWYSPRERMILLRDNFHVGKNLQKELKRSHYQIAYDTNFREVIFQCRAQRFLTGTWITSELLETFCLLHEQGHAHSVEVYEGGRLIGGLYGLLIKGIFCGESMFHVRDNTSKIAMFYLVKKLEELKINIIDCQTYTPNTAALGAYLIDRSVFLNLLKNFHNQKELIGCWV